MQTPKRVLVVDDQKMNRMLVEVMLASAGCVVTQAESGVEALELLGREPFDVVLLDISMPGMSGDEVIVHIRANPAYHGMRVVAYTAHAMEGDRSRLLRRGFDSILTKPISGASLMAALAFPA